jgi:hypothetical protein
VFFHAGSIKTVSPASKTPLRLDGPPESCASTVIITASGFPGVGVGVAVAVGVDVGVRVGV